MGQTGGTTLLTVTLLAWTAASPPGSAGIRPCPVDQADLEDCIKHNLNAYIPLLAKGSEEVPGLDPLLIPGVESEYEDGKTDLSLSLKNLVILGLAQAKVYLVRGKSLEEGKLELMAKIPEVIATGIYAGKWTVINLPLYSNGPFNLTLRDLTSHVVVHLTSVREHIQITDIGLHVMPSLIDVRAGRQLDGENELGETLNVYLNENSFELYSLVQPRLIKFFSQLIKDLANLKLLDVHESTLFPNLQLKK